MRWIWILAVLAVLALPAPADAEWVNGRRLDHSAAHRSKVVIVPTRIYVVPSQCQAQGYWNYSWIPQISSYNLWVPGAWSPDGFWIEGHYEQRLSSSGYWQPYWVEGRWGAC